MSGLLWAGGGAEEERADILLGARKVQIPVLSLSQGKILFSIRCTNIILIGLNTCIFFCFFQRFIPCYFKMGKYKINTETQMEKRTKAKKREDLVVGLLGRLLRSGTFRFTILFIYLAYLAVSVYGILNVVVYFDR